MAAHLAYELTAAVISQLMLCTVIRFVTACRFLPRDAYA